VTTVTPAPDQNDGENEPGLHPAVPLPTPRQPATGEIAYLLGCDDTNSFYRAFRIWTGTTPETLWAATAR
jgi:AraC-like DNA-binding protein